MPRRTVPARTSLPNVDSSFAQLRAVLLGAGCALAALLGQLETPATAHAFCRTTTEPPTPQQAATQECVTEGYPLFWSDLEIHYGFNPARASKDLSEDQVRDVFARGFAQWAKVSCDDGAPGFDFVQDEDDYTELMPAHTLGKTNYNAMLFRPAGEWTTDAEGNEYPEDAYALTGVWYNTKNGELLGADMEINEGRGPYAVCPDSGCVGGVSDLGNVVTHEIGHMIGFAHSSVADATMYYNAPPGQISKRDLHSDDKAAVCDVYSPSAVLAREPEEEKKGCTIGLGQTPSFGAPFWAFGLALVTLVRRRTRS